jgi:hypothetical protein
MSTHVKATAMNRDSRPARNVMLAGIGAVSLLRKNAGKSWTEATAIAGRLPEASSVLLEGIGERSTAMIEEIGVRGNAFRWEFARLARVVRREASNATTKVVAEVETRLQPLLRKLDLGKAQPKRGKVAKRAKKVAKPVAKSATRNPRKAA